MTWKTLAQALQDAIAKGVVAGERDGGTSRVSPERPAAVKPPAKLNRDVADREHPTDCLPTEEDYADRSIATACPTRLPTSAVVIDLAVYRARCHSATA